MNKYLKLLIWIFVYVGVSFAIGMVTQSSVNTWYADLEKPPLTPPNIVFPIVWTILYIMIATAGWKLWQDGAKNYLKTLFIRYTLLNWAWTPVFFGFQFMFSALGVIILLNIAAILIIKNAWKDAPKVAYLMIPPTLWTLFAMYLNGGIYFLNT